MAEVLDSGNGANRRDFLIKAAIGLAAAAGLGAVVRSRLLRKTRTVVPLELDEDSIFMPRADQRDRVLGRK